MTNDGRLFMLGIALSAVFVCCLFVIPVFLEMPFGWETVLGLLAMGALAFVGFGLVAAYRPSGRSSGNDPVFVRWVGVAMFALLILWGLWFWFREAGLAFSSESPSWTLDTALASANSTVTTALLVWVFFRAATLLVRFGRKPGKSASRITCMLTGLTFVVVGACHLVIAIRAEHGIGGMQFTISTSGMYFAGFTGWIWWNGLVLLAGLPLLLGMKQLSRMSAVALAVLFALASPLVLHKLFAEEMGFGISLTLIAAVLPLIAASLFFWMQWELATPVPAPSQTPQSPSDRSR
jgi:hypothetical protein